MGVYVLAGPADCGNVFGVFQRQLVPAGRFAVVCHGEYTNGGAGPSTVDGKLYASRAVAVAAAQQRSNDQYLIGGKRAQ